MGRKKKKATLNKDEVLLRYLYAIILITVALVGIFQTGIVGEWLTNVVAILFGNLYLIIFILMILIGGWMIVQMKLPQLSFRIIFGIIMLILAIALFLAIPQDKTVGKEALNHYLSLVSTIYKGDLSALYGGIIGAGLYFVTSSLFDIEGTWIVIVSMILLSFLLIVDRKYFDKVSQSIASWKNRPKKAKKEVEDEVTIHTEYNNPINNDKLKPISFNKVKEDKKEEPVITPMFTQPLNEKREIEKPIISETVESNTEAVNKAKVLYNDYADYHKPQLSRMLDRTINADSKKNELAAKEKGKKLINILNQFGYPSKLVDIYIGPSVTKFVIKPDSGVKINRINTIQDNIKMELAAKDIRIEAPISGLSAVGVEIPNQENTVVHLREIMEAIPAENANKKLIVALGKDLMGTPICCQLDKMPHLLIAGATGSGKSVCINTIIVSLLLRTAPNEVKLLLIDPKKVEFSAYRSVPHLIGPVITDCKLAAKALENIVTIMDERYKEFANVSAKNITEYNNYVKVNPQVNKKKMPYIVVIIDELADLMNVAGRDVEASIQRITQLARASGIHLIVATQRPSTDVITGIIKSNLNSRIAFAVASSIDSRTILDQMGAERLLGNGDMLYFPTGTPSPTRIQGVYVTDKEIERICEFVSTQATPCFDDRFIEGDSLEGNDGYQDASKIDPMYDQVVKVVIADQKCSTSYLQRKFGFGYNRAAKIVDALQNNGIVGPINGSKPREVLVKAPVEENE